MLNHKRDIPSVIYSRLNVFSVCAKTLSFTVAAQHLYVTAGAISQQIKLLEDWLGFKLFIRATRELTLSEEGARLAKAIEHHFSAISLEIARVSGGHLSGVVRLRAVPSFLSIWLMPRLPDFQQKFPHIELKLEAEDSSRALLPGTFDLAIDLNDGLQNGLQQTPLFKEKIFPVCAPSLLSDKQLRSPEDLHHFPLLHDVTAWRGSDPYAEWENYLAAIDASHIDVRRGYMFNRNHIVMQAAMAGMGVAIARQTLSQTQLKNGCLIAPFAQRVETEHSYSIMYAPGALDDRRVKVVHDWIQTQATESQ